MRAGDGRTKRRLGDPYALQVTAEQARASIAEDPATLGELEVAESLALEAVCLRPQDYMRLVETIRLQHEALADIVPRDERPEASPGTDPGADE